MELVSTVQNQIAPWISKVADPLRRSFLLSRVADLTGLARADIERVDTDSAHMPLRAGVVQAKPEAIKDQLSRFEFELLGSLFFVEAKNIDRLQLEECLAQPFIEISLSCQQLLTVFSQTHRAGTPSKGR